MTPWGEGDSYPPSGTERGWGVAIHLSGALLSFLGPLLLLGFVWRHPRLREHAQNAATFQLLLFPLLLVGVLFFQDSNPNVRLAAVAGLLLGNVARAAFGITAAVAAWKGNMYRYPLGRRSAAPKWAPAAGADGGNNLESERPGANPSRGWAMVIHLSGAMYSVIGPLVALVFASRNPRLRRAAVDAATFQAALVPFYVAWVFSWRTTSPLGTILWVLAIVANLAQIYFGIRAAIAAIRGRPERYPISLSKRPVG